MKKQHPYWSSAETLVLREVAQLKTTAALEERLEIGRLEDLFRWLGSSESGAWLKRGGTASTISRKLLEIVHDALNRGDEPLTDKGFIRGSSDLVAALGVSDRTIRNASRQLESLLAQHGLDAKRLNNKAKLVHRLLRCHAGPVKHRASLGMK